MKAKARVGRPRTRDPRGRVHNFRLTEDEARTFRANVLVRGSTISRVIRERIADLLVARAG
jgi:hypothetical protein